MNPKHGENFSPAETARRRDEVVRRMANTPPQPRVNPPTRPAGKKKTTASGRAARQSVASRKAT
jgi:hypothetical protein